MLCCRQFLSAPSIIALGATRMKKRRPNGSSVITVSTMDDRTWRTYGPNKADDMVVDFRIPRNPLSLSSIATQHSRILTREMKQNGLALRALRAKQKQKAKSIAARSGLSIHALRRWEKGSPDPNQYDWQTLQRILKALRCRPKDLRVAKTSVTRTKGPPRRIRLLRTVMSRVEKLPIRNLNAIIEYLQ